MTQSFKEMRKQHGKFIVNKCVEYLKSTNIPSHVLAFLLKSFHLYIPFFHYLTVVYAPIFISICAVGIYWMINFAFFYFDGCLLSKIEYKLEENKEKFINVVDPLFHLLDLEITKHNQWWFTVGIIFSYTFVITGILGYRIFTQLFLIK
jgi:hypothetical protein